LGGTVPWWDLDGLKRPVEKIGYAAIEKKTYPAVSRLRLRLGNRNSPFPRGTHGFFIQLCWIDGGLHFFDGLYCEFYICRFGRNDLEHLSENQNTIVRKKSHTLEKNANSPFWKVLL